jgi:hypothetical protein
MIKIITCIKLYNHHLKNINMKKYLLLMLITVLSVTAFAQNEKYPALAKSPMDMSYFPANYPGLKVQGKETDPLVARIIYCRPQINGRKIFDSLVEYKKVWRLGANEATEIDFFKPVTIDGKKIDAGRYTLYAIPDATKWTIILNSETDTWGAYGYDEKKDILRVDEPVQKQDPSVEALLIIFAKTATGTDLKMVWDNVKVVLPIQF